MQMMAGLSSTHIILILGFQFVLLPSTVYSMSLAENETETIQSLKRVYSVMYIHEYINVSCN